MHFPFASRPGHSRPAVLALAILALPSLASAQPFTPRPQAWTQASFPADAPEAGDWFGDVLAGGDFDGDGRDELVAAAPDDDAGATTNAGSFSLLRGTAGGGLLIDQNTAGVPDAAAPNEGFGLAIVIADLGGASAAGWVHALYSAPPDVIGCQP